jgi:hypothetical protein
MKRIISSLGLGATAIGLVMLGTALVPHHSRLVTKVQAGEFHISDFDSDKACSLRSLKGAYGYYRTGTTPAGPLAAVGQIVYDGQGNFTTRQTIRRNGVTTRDLFNDPPLTGTYQIDPDCTGRGYASDGTLIDHMVVTDNGKEAIIMSLSTGNSVYGVQKKIGHDE